MDNWTHSFDFKLAYLFDVLNIKTFQTIYRLH